MFNNQQSDKYFGKYPGRVIDNSISKNGTHLGELLVEVSAILEECPNSTNSNQPLKTLAKPAFQPGCFFIPDKGAQIWVEFVAGDIDYPIWTGVWYPSNGVPKTHDEQLANEFHKIIRTSSGHVVELDDSKGKEKITILDKTNNNQITMDADGIKLEAGKNTIIMNQSGIKIQDKNGNIIKLDSTGVKMTDGSKGLQFVVLDPIIQWLQTHNHMGNLGAPTPVFPADMSKLIADSLAGATKSKKSG